MFATLSLDSVFFSVFYVGFEELVSWSFDPFYPEACVFMLQGDFSLPVILLLLTRFLGSVCCCLIALFCVRGIALSQILSFYSFMTSDSLGQDTLW
ncbi:hypothetical protein F2Q70_00002152 [Brassica cretica]|uniref:Uncharacterized protein n=1 Tax=Brassica cretica TaxID=69181 RepID=A0A8S9ISI0_BRACR|nr:hypothetical protein F2Q70_00002152 [Brassica cretica]